MAASALGAEGQDGAGDSLVVIDEADLVPASEEFGEGVALAVADFECENALGTQRGVRCGDETAVYVEAVGACEEGGVGLVVYDLRLHGRRVTSGDVGWVRDDGVKAGLGREEIAVEELNAVFAAVGLSVFAGDG